MSSGNTQDEQFNLISLEGTNSIKASASKAKNAYSSYLKEDDGEASQSSQVNIEEENTEQASLPPKEVQKKPPQKAPSKGTSSLSRGTAPLQQTNASGKKYQVSESDDDYFNEDGSTNNLEEVNNRVAELKNSVKVLFSNAANAISAVFLKIGSILMKPIAIVAGILAKVLNVPLALLNRVISALANKMGAQTVEQKQDEAQQEVVEPQQEIKLAGFSDMIELNIIFMDNYKKNLYSQPKNAAVKLSKAEEALIMGLAMEAIRECAEFTAELPPPAEGIFTGIPISKVMEDISEQEILIFLGFVKAFPGKYIGKTWKISETFATWLINNSPTG